MTVAAFNGQALDTEGNVITDFQVEVRHETAGASLATIYSDRAGTTPLGNPFTPSPLDNGHFRFHVAGGAYKIRAFNASTGFEKIWRYVAIGLAAESDDAIHFPGYLMQFDAGTTEDETAIDNGEIRANNASLASATKLYASKFNRSGDSIEARLDELGIGNIIILTAADGSQASFNVVTVADGLGSPTDYVVITVTDHAGATSFEDGEPLSLQAQIEGPVNDFFPAQGGVEGGEFEMEKPPSGSTLAGNVIFDINFNFFRIFENGGTFRGYRLNITEGAASAGADILSDQNIATAAEIRAATAGDNVVSAAGIESASAEVTLTDAATIAVDWDTFINGVVTLTSNRVLGNPTNGQPGTWRTVMVKGDAASSPATARTLTFGNQYKGDIPTLNNIDDHQWYLLMIFCVSTTHFVVSAKEAKDTLIP